VIRSLICGFTGVSLPVPFRRSIIDREFHVILARVKRGSQAWRTATASNPTHHRNTNYWAMSGVLASDAKISVRSVINWRG
jgi:hypothetical protein